MDPDKLYTVATNNYAAGLKDYEGLAEAEEIGQFRACDEILVSFFEQSDEAIEKTLSTPVMVKYDGYKDTVKPSDPNKAESQLSTERPNTGDPNHTEVYLLMFLLSALTIVAFIKKNSMVS